jgi:hypothetical protein
MQRMATNTAFLMKCRELLSLWRATLGFLEQGRDIVMQEKYPFIDPERFCGSVAVSYEGTKTRELAEVSGKW